MYNVMTTVIYSIFNYSVTVSLWRCLCPWLHTPSCALRQNEAEVLFDSRPSTWPDEVGPQMDPRLPPRTVWTHTQPGGLRWIAHRCVWTCGPSGSKTRACSLTSAVVLYFLRAQKDWDLFQEDFLQTTASVCKKINERERSCGEREREIVIVMHNVVYIIVLFKFTFWKIVWAAPFLKNEWCQWRYSSILALFCRSLGYQWSGSLYLLIT